ncbi:MAG: hypothetical protein ACREUQ_11815 [Burkholderiales bacterium]
MLFGAEVPAHPDGFTERSDWPATTGFTTSDEQIEYRETVYDVQGRGFGDRDWLYRRFDSVRTGRRFR